jgi:hypothetical protein
VIRPMPAPRQTDHSVAYRERQAIPLEKVAAAQNMYARLVRVEPRALTVDIPAIESETEALP